MPERLSPDDPAQRLEAGAAVVADLERQGVRFTVDVGAHEALSVIGALQLALRHPNLAPGQHTAVADHARGMVAKLAEVLGPACAELVDAGWGAS